jgi:CrcB protein
VVNASGGLLLGFLMYLAEYGGFFSSDLRLFLAIGLLGSYTTFSTFGYETYRLLELDEWDLAGANILLSVGLCLLGIYLGKALAMSLCEV